MGYDALPFTPELLDVLPEELAELFRGLELKLLEEICSRLKIADNLNEVTVQDIRALRALGIDLSDIKKAIKDTTGAGSDKLESLLDDVVARNQAYYTEMIDLARVTAPERLVDQEDIWAIYEQTKGQYRNITQSMGFLVREGRHRVMLPPAKAYQWALDSAELQVMTGAISYNQAISDAVRQLAESGLRTVSYESGHIDQLDVAVRRAVMTGVVQLSAKYREQSVDYLETDLVECTAHLGARNTGIGPANHASWQGLVYRWSEKPRASFGNYPDFIKTTGYGTGEGLCGWNCRHNFYPFIEGVSERTYSDHELEAMKPENRPKVKFEGKEYDDYQATQMQRRIERTIRKQKRLKTAYEAAGLEDDATAAGARLRTLNKKYREFSKAAKLPEQPERMKVLYGDDLSKRAAAALKVKRDAEAPIREAIRNGTYSRTINPEKQARHMAATAKPDRSIVTITEDELQEIINRQAGSGKIIFKKGTYDWNFKEIVSAGKEIGYTINANGDIIPATSIKIHYSKTGVHAVPFSGRWKK